MIVRVNQLEQPIRVECWLPVLMKSNADSINYLHNIFDRIFVWRVVEDLKGNGGDNKIEIAIELNIPTCLDYVISPKAGYLATFEKFSNTDQEILNFSIWKLNLSDGTAEKSVSFSHKNQATWTPQWTMDDSIMGRMVTREIHFHSSMDLDSVKSFPTFRVVLDGLSEFSISPSIRDFKCAVFAKESKGKPGSVRIYPIEAVNGECVAQKTFFKADRCQLYWSPNGRSLLAVTSTDVDKTGKSYYGESNLYFLAHDGQFDCRVDLNGGGPIHDVSWSPLSNEFIIVHGFMPATTSLFDLKCKQVYDFTCGSKNQSLYNAAGNLICFGGFGNLPGTIEIWRRTGAVSRVGAMQSVGTTVIAWSPDGSVLLTAVLTPRLRVDNGFKLWSMYGELLAHVPYNELYQVAWVPSDSTRFAAPKIENSPISAFAPSSASSATSPTISATGELKKEAYRPPSLRNKPPSSISAPVKKTPPPPVSLPASISKEARTVRRIQEKLTSIAAIKAKHAAGENLEPEQIEKMAREADVQKELDNALNALKLSQ
jgi:translation initiation factor 2A